MPEAVEAPTETEDGFPADSDLAADVEELRETIATAGGEVESVDYIDGDQEPLGELQVACEASTWSEATAILRAAKPLADDMSDLVVRATFRFEEDTEFLQEQYRAELHFPASVDGGMVYV